MKGGLSRISVPFLTIRVLIALWAVSILLVWAVLVVGWLTARKQLEELGNRVVMDTRALDAARELELAILAHRREDLLWEATGQDYHRQHAHEHLLEAERISGSLGPYVTTAREHQLWARIREELKVFREPASPGSVEAEAQSVYALLEAVERFQAQNKSQMEESVRAASRLHDDVSDWAIALSLGTAALLSLGAAGVIRRVVRPALALGNAADAFGDGDFTARAPILHNDELGSLARTFNNMAHDIATREADRLQFVAMVVHDLKNPVLAIEMAARLLRTVQGDEQERDLCLNTVAEEARRLRTIIRDLTDDIQVASGRFSVRQTTVDLCALVRQLIQAQATAFSDHRIVVETDHECHVSGDPGRLERVVMNLVSNAVKYSPRGTQVTVRVEKKESFALLSISDQGPGIRPEDLQVIFQPFGRGRSADTLAEGSGMGLYVVKQIIEAHGGQIDVGSTPGHGATFRVRLPLVRANEPIASRQAETVALSGRRDA